MGEEQEDRCIGRMDPDIYRGWTRKAGQKDKWGDLSGETDKFLSGGSEETVIMRDKSWRITMGSGEEWCMKWRDG